VATSAVNVDRRPLPVDNTHGVERDGRLDGVARAQEKYGKLATKYTRIYGYFTVQSILRD